ncbi:MAG: TIGR02186 family protein [Phreatobacter sp.]|uniref:TIGR02186 family protein n=1 Tax=Phreatobacter sp. TaxID=1966341 RepID=UPI002732C235|nr:TIGR02186 family protein [Phreatobacter sp.]MDP2802229.1 TIGR02186 family protein [Phreatobacter sp.]
MSRIVLVILVLLTVVPARAETMITSLSTHRLQITSNFVGSEIVLFGSIERDAQTISRPGGYDMAVVVRGPRALMVTRQKTRFFGIWVNTDSRQFVEMPAFYALLSNKAAADLADIELRARQQIGVDSLTAITPRLGPDPAATPAFRDALLRINRAKGLYRENPTGVTFLTPNLFRANIPIVPNTPVGSFDVDIFLMSGGVILARESTNFEVTKTGFEAFVANAARDHGVLYGLAAAMLALFTGWAASVVFRRD